jgi:hypothetical protein
MSQRHDKKKWKLFSIQCFQISERSKASHFSPSGKTNVEVKMSMERWCNDIHRRKAKYSEKNLSQYNLAHHKSQKGWHGLEPGPPGWQAGD